MKKVKVMPIFKKGKKDNPGNYRLVSLTPVPWKMAEQILLEATTRQMQKKVFGKSQHRFIKKK